MSEEGKKKVAILVEDNDEVANTLSLMLGFEGYTVVRNINGAGVVDQIKQMEAEGHNPAILITDYGLKSSITGGKVIEAVRSENPNMPVLMVTAYPEAKVRMDMEQDGEPVNLDTIAFLQKPFLASRLVAAIEAADQAAARTHTGREEDRPRGPGQGTERQ